MDAVGIIIIEHLTLFPIRVRSTSAVYTYNVLMIHSLYFNILAIELIFSVIRKSPPIAMQYRKHLTEWKISN